VRFIIYREEFVHGVRTTELRDAMFATENEAIARAKQGELFDREVERYLSDYGHTAAATKDDIMIIRAPECDRFVGIGLVDELRPETHVTS